MWSISELKQRGKIGFKANYWKCVLVGLILSWIAPSAGGGAATGNVASQYTTNSVMSGNDNLAAGLVALLAVLSIVVIVAIVASVLRFLVFTPIEVGCHYFFSENTNTISGLGCLARGFDGGNYWRVVKTMFLKGLFQILWTMLFIIPGLVKAYEYRMIPYLLADESDMTTGEIFATSKEMMAGNKMKAFLLDLSFIGWNLLGAVTFGLVAVFYANPYQQATNAELYQELRAEIGI